MARWPPCLLTIYQSLLLTWVLTAPASGDRGGVSLLQTDMTAPALRSSGLHQEKANAHHFARAAGYGLLGKQICGMYDAHFRANGSDINSCRHFKPHLPVQDMCDDFPDFCEGNLNKQRCEMPQIPSGFSGTEDDDFATWKEVSMSDGINITEEKVDLAYLVSRLPSQKFLSRCKVCSMVWGGNACFAEGEPTADTCKNGHAGCYCFWDSGVSVTEDGYVLDGHHRWASSRIMLSDKTLRQDMQATVELYVGVPNHAKATVDRVIETANKHPELAKHTKCSAEVLLWQSSIAIRA